VILGWVYCAICILDNIILLCCLLADSESTNLWSLRQRAPFAGLFVAASVGVMASDQQPECWPGWLFGFVCTALIALKIRSTFSICLVTFFIFAFWHGNQVATDPGYQRSRAETFDTIEHTVTLLIKSEPKVDQLRSTQRFFALVSCIDNRPADLPVFAEASGEPFSYGDRIISQGKFSVPSHPMNPGEFDFGSYLRRQNIYLNFRALRDVPALVTAHNQGSPFVAAALAARHGLAQVLQDGLEDDPEVAQTVQGMILGGRAETSADLKELFRDTGTIHLFAASGLQVSLFAGLAWSCLRYVRLPRPWAALSIVPVVVTYCAVTGFYPATVRATVMAILMSIGVSLERPVAKINSLCASGLLILIHDTQELFQSGFELSFAAVFAIMTAVRPLAELLFRPFQIDPFLPIQLLERWQRILYRTIHRTCEVVSLSIVCWCATLPILIFQEHRVSLVAIFANLLVVPLATTVMLLGVAAMLFSSLSGWIAACLNNTCWLITKVILMILHGAALVPCHSINVSLSSLIQPDRVTVLCEGSGQVIHVHLKGHDCLVNTGRLSQWRAITEPYLQSQGVNRLDTLILCNAHPREATDQAKSEFQVDKVISSEAVLVRLGQFRVLILPDLNQQTLSTLKCDHADVVYCAHLQGQRLTQNSLVAKLSPSVLVLGGSKAQISANSFGAQTRPKCFCLRRDGAITAALRDGDLFIHSYRGSELRLRSLSR
jgi:ComEC/Rec2-related protein